MGDNTKNKRIDFAELLDKKGKKRRIEDFQAEIKAQKKQMYWVHPVGCIIGFWTNKPEKYAPAKFGSELKRKKKQSKYTNPKTRP